MIRDRLKRQRGVVADWQLTLEVSAGSIRHVKPDWQRMYDGVHISGHAAPTDWQRLYGATVTAPDSVLDAWASAWFYGLVDRLDGAVDIVRPGSAGVRELPSVYVPLDPQAAGDVGSPDSDLATTAAGSQAPGRGPTDDTPPATGTAIGRPDDGDDASSSTDDKPLVDPRFALNVRRSECLDEVDLRTNDGIAMLSPARTVVDLLALLYSSNRRARLVRDALRLRVVTPAELHEIARRGRGRRGVGRLRPLLDVYARLPMDEAKSDAEALAVALLVAAGFPEPRLNVLVEGEEGDLVFPAERHIVELDSHGFHPFPGEDERKQAIWINAGWTVDRAPTDSVYTDPAVLYRAATPPRLR
ncbi:MAG: hypothetical protein J7513_18480 [Solirubrobacteraceae bacterium]|nr:hypothetical protein [Solirubrobacteraceae bacterium]